MFEPTLTLDADVTVAAARTQLDGVSSDRDVVVRRAEGLETYWYRFSVRIVRMILDRAHPDQPLVDALNLHESDRCEVFDADTLSAADAESAYGVVLDGGRAVGVLDPVTEEATRGGGGLESAPPPPAGVAPPAETAAPPPEASPAPPPAAAPSGTGFSAFPHLDSPDFAVVDEPIELVVKLATEAQAGTGDVAMTVPTDLPEFDLIVQVIADGFTIPRVRDVLHVDRNNLDANEVRFTLVANAIAGPAAATKLEVEFSFGGSVCGRAWRSIAIIPSAAGAQAVPEPTGGASAVTAVADPVAADLEVSITEDETGRTLHWRFVSRHDIEIPNEAVQTRFDAQNAKAFALGQMRQAQQSIGDAAIAGRMRGIGREIADQLPQQFWQVLAKVWETKRNDADPIPSVLLLSTDAFVPWELAYIENNDVAALLDPKAPPFLGAQVRIGRWMKSSLQGNMGKQNPVVPPPPKVDMNQMALVIGDYLSSQGRQRDLPKAKEEGNALGALYSSVRLAATVEELIPLLEGKLVIDGETVQPAILHFACHGAIEPNNPQFNGIILSDGNKRLDELQIRGNQMRSPFVFLNACQLATPTEQLGDYGGMASAFLKTGAKGFVAPLWSVDDQIAHDIALGFYQAAIDEGTPLGEVIRRQRANFDMDAAAPAKPESTYLAYVYYGHPNMQMSTT